MLNNYTLRLLRTLNFDEEGSMRCLEEFDTQYDEVREPIDDLNEYFYFNDDFE